MCRLLAYLGDDILLSSLLLTPQHSLEKQAWQPKELREVILNADGYGFTWYNQHQMPLRPSRYRLTLPIWNDPNLNHLANSMCQPLWLAMVRSATPGLGVTLENTQPFCYQQWSFMHNGYILDFSGEIQHKISKELDDEFLYLIKGNTDSEYIFALLMQLLHNHAPIDAIRTWENKIAEIIQGKRALLNIVVCDGEKIYALKHAINGLCPSMYYANSNQEFGINNQLLVSEKLNGSDDWLEIEDHKIISISTDNNLAVFDL